MWNIRKDVIGSSIYVWYIINFGDICVLSIDWLF